MKYIVWIKMSAADKEWEPNGDGPMGLKTAERVDREIREDFKIPTKVLPAGKRPEL